MNELTKTLITEFQDKEYAHAYMEEFLNMHIAAQIKTLREQRGWSQEQLAAASGMKQERISKLEDVEYDAWTIKTLNKLSEAFDLTLKVSFENFSSGILDAAKISSESLKRTSREEDLKTFNSVRSGYTSWGGSVKTFNQSSKIKTAEIISLHKQEKEAA
ncbi:MAG: helix-turn-helix domain-containing protein [Methylobacter sp.]